jgi:hypothetical protein
MDVLTEQEMGARLDFMRPLNPGPPEKESLWCIPFEWGANAKGTRISIAKAKEIAAELRAAVAEAEKRELRRYFDREKERGDSSCKQSAEWQQKYFEAQGEITTLKRRLNARKKRGW